MKYKDLRPGDLYAFVGDEMRLVLTTPSMRNNQQIYWKYLTSADKSMNGIFEDSVPFDSEIMGYWFLVAKIGR